jgi:hypothetical protein
VKIFVARRPNPFKLSYLRRLCLRVVSAAVESRLCMSSGALPGPDPLRAIPGVLCSFGLEGLG